MGANKGLTSRPLLNNLPTPSNGLFTSEGFPFTKGNESPFPQPVSKQKTLRGRDGVDVFESRLA